MEAKNVAPVLVIKDRRQFRASVVAIRWKHAAGTPWRTVKYSLVPTDASKAFWYVTIPSRYAVIGAKVKIELQTRSTQADEYFTEFKLRIDAKIRSSTPRAVSKSPTGYRSPADTGMV